jgi:hypothetical protein
LLQIEPPSFPYWFEIFMLPVAVMLVSGSKAIPFPNPSGSLFGWKESGFIGTAIRNQQLFH